MDPRTADRIRTCNVCETHLAVTAGGACACCAAQRAADDGDVAEAAALADDYALVLRDGAYRYAAEAA